MVDYALMLMDHDTEIKTIRIGIRHIIKGQTLEEPFMDEDDLFDNH